MIYILTRRVEVILELGNQNKMKKKKTLPLQGFKQYIVRKS